MGDSFIFVQNESPRLCFYSAFSFPCWAEPDQQELLFSSRRSNPAFVLVGKAQAASSQQLLPPTGPFIYRAWVGTGGSFQENNSFLNAALSLADQKGT